MNIYIFFKTIRIFAITRKPMRVSNIIRRMNNINGDFVIVAWKKNH